MKEWKYPLPEDSTVIQIHRVIIEVADKPKVIRVQSGADSKRSTLLDDVYDRPAFDDVEWSADGKRLAFVSSSRDHKEANLKIAIAETGDVISVMEEKVATRYESGQFEINWRFLSASNEIIWYSARTGWGHLYLYDAATGKLKNQITAGDYVVTKVMKVDQAGRILF